MLTTHPFDDDKLREECGVFGVSGAHRAPPRWSRSACTRSSTAARKRPGSPASTASSSTRHRAMGHVAGNFDRDEVIRALAGDVACGHVRYSTTGETALRNVQPLYAELQSAASRSRTTATSPTPQRLRRDLVRRGSIFQSTSDTETIIHLVATSSYRTLIDRFIDALKQVEGAYSLIVHDAGGDDRLPRSARHPPAGDGPAAATR